MVQVLEYHSALRQELAIDGELDYYEKDGSVVFKHDITNGCHDVFWRADVIYTEPAWQHGYEIFANRAGINQPKPYKEYLLAIKDVIETLSVPAYVVMGRHMVRILRPECTAELRLHGYKCLLGIYNADPINVPNNTAALQHVAQNPDYRCILDFCCGYGNTAAAALRAGKKFVCSDFNAKCVYYIAKEIMGANF